jgi:hypothetical protein
VKILGAERGKSSLEKGEGQPEMPIREMRPLLVVFGLVKEEVGGELFVLVTGEISLNGLVPRES